MTCKSLATRAGQPRPLRLGLLAMTVSCVVAWSLAGAPSAAAAAGRPWWHLTSHMIPSRLTPGGEATIAVQALNLGNGIAVAPITLSDVLPAGVTLTKAEFFASDTVFGEKFIDFGPAGVGLEVCETTASTASCSLPMSFFEGEEPFAMPFRSYAYVEMHLRVKAEPSAVTGSLNHFEVTSPNAPAVAAKRPVAIGNEPVAFGLEEFTLAPEEEGGGIDTRAGSHPYQLTSTVTFTRSSEDPFVPPALPRNLDFKLPPGQIGNATAVPQCSAEAFARIGRGEYNGCPSTTAIGVAFVSISTISHEEETAVVPIFNLTPARGEPARFGFEVVQNPVILDTSVRSGPGEDYGVTVHVKNITQVASFLSATTVFWGVPRDPVHNDARGWGCLPFAFTKEALERGLVACEPSHDAHPPAFLTLPASCSASFAPSAQGESWPRRSEPGAEPRAVTFPPLSYQLADNAGNPLGLTGCNQVAFGPSFEVEPSTQNAAAPSGLDVNLRFADEGLTAATGIAQSQIKDTTVTLPEGLTINPSSGVGLGGCTVADYERETLESPPGAGCPNNSKLGTVEITTPLLTQTIHGSLFVAQPYENPFPEPEHGHPGGTLIALYIVAKNPETGVIIKLAGKVTPNPVTGQLTATFQNNPQLPFDHFNFHFREGQQAPLITPAVCGTYTAQALMTSWSEPLQALTDTSSFTITKGFDGGACPSGAPPFSPQIIAGTAGNAAGAYSPFDLRLTRNDGESEISRFSTVLPPGLVGVLTGIPFCPESDIALARGKTGAQEQASASCPAASQLGHSLVGTGVGAVLAYTPGKLYLAGPYNGDPFSLVSVTSAVVGPFDLGTVVVRFGLRIDPRTAQVSVDPTASEPIPHIIDGIVTHVRDIRVYVDRPNFTLNPTSCEPMSISSTLASSLGQSATISSPFQAASCASLKFAPKFTVSTSGKNSKANGAGLTVKIVEPGEPLGSQANIAKVKVELPKQLPSRLTTLQKACTAAQFDSNPAGCPQASIIGHARVHTPTLPVPLEGPAYFVSNGGEAFPNLIMVLQGYGVTVDLVGDTFISKAGITSSTFKTVPDVPFSTFELTLPRGPNSALATNVPARANYSLCGQRLTMPTEFVAQNGALLNQATRVSVTGCAKTKTLTRSQKLARALKACHKRHSHAKRAACERAARKRYRALKKGKKK